MDISNCKRTSNLDDVFGIPTDTVYFGKYNIRDIENAKWEFICIFDIPEDVEIEFQNFGIIKSKNMDFLNPIILKKDQKVKFWKDGKKQESIFANIIWSPAIEEHIKNNNIVCRLAHIIHDKDKGYIRRYNTNMDYSYKNIYSDQILYNFKTSIEYQLWYNLMEIFVNNSRDV